jgi:hypothetical protein
LESAQPARDQPPWGDSSSETLEATRVDEQHRIAREKSHPDQEIDPDVIIVDWDGPNDPENPYVYMPTSHRTCLTRLCQDSTGQYGRNGFLQVWLFLEHSSPL